MSRAPDLSPRDEAVLEFVHQVRVASADQIERALFPPALGSALSAARRCRRVLARLHDTGLLHRLERRVGGAPGSSGYRYTITSRGLRRLGRSTRVRRYEPSERYLAHTLAAVELHVELLGAERRGAIGSLRVSHEPATWRRFAGTSAVETLKPDLLVELDLPDGWELRWFVEVDRATEHLPAVLRKCQAYQRYWRSGREAQVHDVFPRVLWSVPSERRAAAIEGAIRRAGGLSPELFVVTTAEHTVAALIGEPCNNNSPKGGAP